MAAKIGKRRWESSLWAVKGLNQHVPRGCFGIRLNLYDSPVVENHSLPFGSDCFGGWKNSCGQTEERKDTTGLKCVSHLHIFKYAKSPKKYSLMRTQKCQQEWFSVWKGWKIGASNGAARTFRVINLTNLRLRGRWYFWLYLEESDKFQEKKGQFWQLWQKESLAKINSTNIYPPMQLKDQSSWKFNAL